MVTTIVPCKECHEHPCTCEEEEIKMEIKCNCGKTLLIIDRYYKGGIAVKNILVKEHECLQYSPAYNDWCEEYYAYEGDVDDKT